MGDAIEYTPHHEEFHPTTKAVRVHPIPRPYPTLNNQVDVTDYDNQAA